MSLYLGRKKVGTNNTIVKGVPKVKFGATIDDMLGEVNEKGEYLPPSVGWHFDGSSIKKIPNNGMSQICAYNVVTSVDFSNLEWVGAGGLLGAFRDCYIVGHLNLSKLGYSGSSGLNSAFYGCKITSVDLSQLKQTYGNALQSTFYNNNVASLDVRNLTTVANATFQTAFYGNAPENGRVDVYLPADGSGWATGAMPANVWSNSPTITEIHFSAHSEEWVSKQTGYASKFGATNADIYFDLE